MPHRVRRKRQRLTSNDPIETAPVQHTALLPAASARGSPDRDLSFMSIKISLAFRFDQNCSLFVHQLPPNDLRHASVTMEI